MTDPFPPEVVAQIARHMNDDHAAFYFEHSGDEDTYGGRLGASWKLN